jgi:hypothetical protein
MQVQSLIETIFGLRKYRTFLNPTKIIFVPLLMSFLPLLVVIYGLYSVRHTLQSYNTNIFYVSYPFFKMCIARHVQKCPPCKSVQNFYKSAALALTEVGGPVEGHFLPCTWKVHHYYFTYLTLIRHFQSTLVHTDDNGSQWHLYFRNVVTFQVEFCCVFKEVSMHCNTYHVFYIKLFESMTGASENFYFFCVKLYWNTGMSCMS